MPSLTISFSRMWQMKMSAVSSSFHSTPMPSAVRVFTAMWRLLPLMVSYSGASPL